ncbi:hypothetical protein BDV95DRAFT_626369 [Massariosphaeria phaeospora]|uniref:Hypervirulence associated protein TUDOR domain-containing protein n=1 Tax=Massariosphaeria phaeospora TaxID=100035 RepID=A0A7C8MD14_9PLEO|nr:hypothetical protein BDV95DRAFT_626369 [Massariosphaeria phaeospora]
MPSKDKYTDPELRDEVKEEIHQSDKGGAPGQWSARKAQMMASEYKKRGGGYNTEKKDKDQDQKHLDDWTKEEWQTKEGSGHAKQDDGTEKRYLPKKAWEQMSEKEKVETEHKKQQGGKEGKQHVANTPEAKEARKQASKDAAHDIDSRKNLMDCTQHWEDAVQQRADKDELDKSEADDDKSGDDAEGSEHSASAQSGDETKQQNPKKRGRGSTQNGAAKKQKKGDRKGEPNGTAGSTKPPSGFVNGEVVEVAYEEKTVEGKAVKAGSEDPRVVLRSSSSGRVAVHKLGAVYF